MSCPSQDKLLSLEVAGSSKVEAHLEGAPHCQPQERRDAVPDKKNGFGSSPTENICCEMECPQSNREISTSLKVSKQVVVKLIPVTHMY